MAFGLFDRVRETCFASGGNFVVTGAYPGYQTSINVYNSGDTGDYLCQDNGNPAQWETGQAQFISGSWTRTQLYEGCSGAAAVFASGNVSQFVIDLTAKRASQIQYSGTIVGLASGSVQSGQIANGAIVSGGVASGQIGFPHLGNGSVQSGTVGSGQIAQFHLSSGTVNSGHVANNAIGSGNLASGQIAQMHLSSGAVNSGHMGSGSVLGRNAGGAFVIASGSIGSLDIGSGAIVSGLIGSGQVGLNHLSFTPTVLSSGLITSGFLGNASVLSGTIGSGQVSFFHIAPNSVQSGTLASGAVMTFHLNNQTIAPGAFQLAPLAPNLLLTLNAQPVINTEETISGIFTAVCISKSGNLRIAMAGVSGRMPAVGVVQGITGSGIAGGYIRQGWLFSTLLSGAFSGFFGQPLYVGRSGQIVTASGSFNSGGFASGDIVQPIGVVVNSISGSLFDMNVQPIGFQAASGSVV